MNELTLFNSGAAMPALNDYVDPLANLSLPSGVSHPRISIKNGRFTVIKDGEDTVLDSLVLHAIIIGVNATDHRSWYTKAWDPKAEPTSPDCWSANDATPDASSASPQSASCATCPHNAWGSSRKAGSEGKDCSAHRRIVVLAEGDEAGDQYTINIPGSSIRNFGTYRKALIKKNAAFQRVVTKISFDPTAVGTLTYDAVNWVPADTFLSEVAPRVMDESVLDALDVSYSGSVATAQEEFVPAEVAKPTPAAKARPSPVAVEGSPVVETNVPPPTTAKKGFGAAKTVTSPAETPAAKSAPVVVAGSALSDVEAELDKMLAGASDA